MRLGHPFDWHHRLEWQEEANVDREIFMLKIIWGLHFHIKIFHRSTVQQHSVYAFYFFACLIFVALRTNENILTEKISRSMVLLRGSSGHWANTCQTWSFSSTIGSKHSSYFTSGRSGSFKYLVNQLICGYVLRKLAVFPTAQNCIA